MQKDCNTTQLFIVLFFGPVSPEYPGDLAQNIAVIYIDIFCKNILDFFYLAASNVCLYTLASNEEVQTAIYLSFDHAHRALKSTKKSNLRNHSAKSSAGSPR